jgi:chromosome segregation ATPase
MATERRKVESRAGGKNPAGGSGEVAEIEVLRQKYGELQTKKTRAETNLENAREQLEKLKKEAREAYGTDDLGELKAKLAEIKAENEAKTTKYRKDLEKIEADLQAVEENYKTSAEESA